MGQLQDLHEAPALGMQFAGYYMRGSGMLHVPTAGPACSRIYPHRKLREPCGRMVCRCGRDLVAAVLVIVQAHVWTRHPEGTASRSFLTACLRAQYLTMPPHPRCCISIPVIPAITRPDTL